MMDGYLASGVKGLVGLNPAGRAVLAGAALVAAAPDLMRCQEWYNSTLNSPLIHFFPQTGKTVAGRFWETWQTGRTTDDSIFINGLPVTDKHEEISPTDGKTYTVQWFERSRLEEHPENNAPNDVLLGLLGASATQNRHDGPFQTIPDPKNGLQWFSLTQHTVGDKSIGGQAIANTWARWGGLRQFGYPLSQPFEEVNQGNNQKYLVQYFERQRFEYHPEYSAPYNVLLGRLGAEQMLAPPVPTPVPAPVPPTTASKLVLAFFFPWYGSTVWDRNQMSDFPSDPYESSNPITLDHQIQQAQSVGIDSFISTWTGQGTEVDKILPTLVQIANQRNFHITVYFELDSIKLHGDIESQVKGVMDRYSANLTFLHWNGKPVFFFWRPDAYGDDINAWKELRNRLDPNHSQIWSADAPDSKWLEVFDTIHLFAAGKWEANTDVDAVDMGGRLNVDAYNQKNGTQRLWTAGVSPGWDESKIQPPRPNPRVILRRDGATYNESWCAAIKSRPEWITITSWNEWKEGSQIEPSEKYGNQYLDLTKKWIEQYKSGAITCSPY
jgi:hypothetical protein